MYFVAGQDSEMNRLLSSKDNLCFVVPTAPSVVTSPRTGNGTIRGKLHTAVFRVAFLFKRPAGYESYSRDGYEVTEQELVYHMADRIRGAALLAAYKYAVDEDNIHEVDVLTAYADIVVVENNKLMGRAILEISVLQNVEIPMPTYSAL